MIEIDLLENYYQIDSSSSWEEVTTSLSKTNPPLSLGRNFHCDVFRTHFDLFVTLDEKVRENINEFYNRIETLNSIHPMYENAKSYGQQSVFRELLVRTYYDKLRLAWGEVEEIDKLT